MIAIIQNRLGSTRFPTKNLESIWNGKSGQQILIDKFKSLNIPVIIATPDNPINDPLIQNAKENNVMYYQGSENNVLRRVINAVINNGFKPYETIIDITSDCVLMDIQLLNNMIRIFENFKYDYYSNTITRSYADGYDIQIYKLDSLIRVQSLISKEHQTHTGWNIINYLGELQEEYNLFLRIGNYCSKDKYFKPHWRLVLDYKEDLELLRKIYLHFNKLNFTYEEVISYLLDNPDILKINKDKYAKLPGLEL